ncbi:MarR family winged helix-turn-helix transcriptional regulator [Frankia canadensis]|nr:MarR family winged helix-turn-helix transcriptional regulator [Frankia canadensis]
MDAPPPPQPRWLDAAEQETWLALVGVLIRLPAALDAQLQRDAGISHFEYQVLAGLSMADEHTLRMSDLAAFTEGSLPRLSQVASRLEKRGWVRRMPDPVDGRYTLAILTEDGWAKVVATAPGHVDAVRRLVFDPLNGAQQRQLREIGRRVLAAVDPAGAGRFVPPRRRSGGPDPT